MWKELLAVYDSYFVEFESCLEDVVENVDDFGIVELYLLLLHKIKELLEISVFLILSHYCEPMVHTLHIVPEV